MYKNLLEMEEHILKQHKVQPDEDYEIDVFDEDEKLITTIRKSHQQH
jgi:hypothetical protein